MPTQEKKQQPQNLNNSPVAKDLAARILKNGPITVAEYMNAAVSHYYAGKDPFGIGGDFTTAPEVSQMFGEMIGAWFVDIWLQMGQPDQVQLIELGPGRGTLMADIMRTISSWPDFKAAVSVHLVETSPQLRQAQANMLKACQPIWYDRLEEIPAGFSFIVTNEFFDALPIHQFKKVKGEWMERAVSYDELENSFHFTFIKPDFDLGSIMTPEFLNAHDGSIYEISPAGLAVLEEISMRIAENGGAALIVDYGHIVPGLGDTLQSLHQHRYSDVLENPGTKDLTAHVDFATFKTVAEQMVRVHGPVTQGEFLTTLGITGRAEALAANATEEQAKDIKLALYRLTAGAEMGRLFKVMGLTPQSSTIAPAGFNDEIPDNEA